MVVRKQNNSVPPALLYSAAGAFAAIVTVIFAVRSVLISDPIAQCSARYTSASVLPYQSNSQLLTSSDIQARLRERDWGLQANGRIVPVAGGPATAALEVALPAGGKDGGTTASPVSGLGFRWTPSFLKGASRACLSYHVWLPAEFDFGRDGVLPGLYGGDPKSALDERGMRAHFTVRPKWLADGRGGLHAITAWEPRGIARQFEQHGYRLPRGAWVAIEQEVVLNTPGHHDGVLRIWIDGELRFAEPAMAYRHRADLGFSGIAADMHYVATNTIDWQPAPSAGKIRITPFVVRWQ